MTYGLKLILGLFARKEWRVLQAVPKTVLFPGHAKLFLGLKERLRS